MPVLASVRPRTAASVFKSLVLTNSHIPTRSSTFSVTCAVAPLMPVKSVRAMSAAVMDQRAYVIRHTPFVCSRRLGLDYGVRPPQQPISHVEVPHGLRKWECGDSSSYSAWPEVAAAVIKAPKQLCQCT